MGEIKHSAISGDANIHAPHTHQSSHIGGSDPLPVSNPTNAGLLKKLDENAAHYMDGSGNWSTPVGSGGGTLLPVDDITSIVKGSVTDTKQMRFEVDGFAGAATRVMTVPDKDITLCDTDEVMLLSGTHAMAGNLDPDGDGTRNSGDATHRWNEIHAIDGIFGDMVFEERTCEICGSPLVTGEAIALVVKKTSDNGTHTVPAHLRCVKDTEEI